MSSRKESGTDLLKHGHLLGPVVDDVLVLEEHDGSVAGLEATFDLAAAGLLLACGVSS